jgi:UDP-N-acetyl-D-glucosamine dehydrogenase
LERRGARISVLDPLVGSDRIKQHGYQPVTDGESLSRFQLAVVLTDHSAIDYEGLVAQVPLIYDTRGVFRRLGIESERISVL